MRQPGLFAYFSSQHAASEENWATEALTFVLSGCMEAREALHDYVLRSFQIKLAADLSYRTQVTDPETGRPDVVATDPTGSDQLIIEAKFWAGLTRFQPGGYLERLDDGKPGVVLAVAPAARLVTLWPELLAHLAAYRNGSIQADHEPGRCELVLPSGHVLALRSWRAVLDELDGRLHAAGLSDWRADLAQLRSLTERMDQPGFQPLLAQDLDIRTARQISSLFPLVRRLVDEFGTSDRIEKGDRKHSYDPPYFGWWLQSKGCGISIWVGLYMKAWAKLGRSPLWAAIYSNPQSGWTMPKLDQALSAMQFPAGASRWEDEDEPAGAFITPLMLRRSAVEDDVIADLKTQLSAIAETLDRAATDAAPSSTPSEANDVNK